MNLIDELIRILKDVKSYDIKVYDMAERSFLADTFIVASADSMIQIDTVREKIRRFMRENGKKLYNPLEQWGGGWLIMDYGEIILNVFLEEKRSFYNFDDLINSKNITFQEIKDAIYR